MTALGWFEYLFVECRSAVRGNGVLIRELMKSDGIVSNLEPALDIFLLLSLVILILCLSK